MKFRRLQLLLKRIIDILISGSLLVLLSPVMLVAVALILLKMGPPVLFRHSRPGLNEKIFVMYKFRTMTDDRDKEGNLLQDKERLSGIGLIIRSLSIDELPQLWNVLKGNMSLVGARPLLIEYLEHYSPEQHRRHNMKPGITGLAQISGRNDLSWEEKFKLDVYYVDNFSLLLDFKILFITFVKVCKKEGINQKGMATAEKFKGN